jgi:hypothetical protein
MSASNEAVQQDVDGSMADNVVWAWWPKHFRTRAFRAAARGGFADQGMFPLSPPTNENVHLGWAWLTDQLYAMGLMSADEVAKCRIEVVDGRTMKVFCGSEDTCFLILCAA